MHLMLLKSKKRRGVVVVLVAVSLVPLVGIAAVALDGGVLMDQHRRTQAAADGAALAAATDLFANYVSNNGEDSQGSARQSALDSAAANGSANNGTSSIVTVNIPPTTGAYTGLPGYAEVTVQTNQQRGYGNIFGTSTIPVKTRAVARGLWVPFQDGVICLDPTSSAALNATGNGKVTVTNASIIVDSNNPSGGVLVGNAGITAPETDLSGDPGYSTSGNAELDGTVKSGQTPTPDPLSYLPQPDPSELTVRSNSKLKLNGTEPTTLQPGVYVGGIDISGKGVVTMAPGLYYMKGGSFSATGQGSLAGVHVMIFNGKDAGGSVGALKIAGLGFTTLTPPTDGLYQGMVAFQDRRSTQAVDVTGNGAMNIAGTFYAANATLDRK